MKVVAFNVPKVKHEAFRLQLDQDKHFYDQLHQHAEIQIMWIEEGEGTLIAGDYVGRFSPGDLFVIGSGQPHVFRSDVTYFQPKCKLKSKAVSIYFNENYLGTSFWQLEEVSALRKFMSRSARGVQLMGKPKEEIISVVHELRNAKGVNKLILFLSVLKKLADAKGKYLSVNPSGNYKSEEGKRMNAILEFTFKESHRKIYLHEVADVANLSVEAFCRYFKLHTRKTYTSFLNEVRVSNACRLLINKDLTMQDVCYQSGFNNLSNFNRIFKKIVGKQPSLYLS
ncbi:MAG TPA: AraC family transcriptional regulator [Cytophagales bacterium]|jgi:AraC-like DNA-binding protein|nr:AraC family transcriptional regulator [Cytophagales bacterium]